MSAGPGAKGPSGATRVAYVMTAFPTVSEAFTLNEMVEVEARGLEIVPVSLSRRRDPTTHPSAEPLVPRTLYLSRSLTTILRANLALAVRQPRRYLRGIRFAFRGRPTSWFSVGQGRSSTWKAVLLFLPLVELADRLRSSNVRHVHASSASIASTGAIVLSRLLDCPYSITGHGSDLSHYPPADLQRRIEGAAFFTTVADFNRRRLIENYPKLDPALVRVIRLGVDLDRFSPAPLPVRRGAQEPPTLLTVARLHPMKGYEILIRAARILARQRRTYRWLLVGDGPMRDWLLETLPTPPLTGRLELLGFKSQEEVRDLYRSASVFVLPSLSEGLPVVLMEALACGIPCISTPVNGVPEILQDGVNGLLVPPDDPVALAAAIRRILEDRALSSLLRSAARPSVVREYDIRRTARDMSALFRKSLAGS